MDTGLVSTGLLTDQHLDRYSEWCRLAESHVAPTVAVRADARRIDRVLWKQLAEQGLAAAMVPADLGGPGLDARSTMLALDAVVEFGHDAGLAVSLNVQNLITRYLLLPHMTEAQRDRWLPGLVAGDTLAAFVVSEPGTGAHPKHFQTTAVRDGDRYRINGHKAYITNGPDCDLMVLIAVTDDSGPLRGISAILVERDTPGVEISAPMDLGFLRTSPHAEVQLHDVVVPAAHLLGPEHDAYRGIVRGFREYEDQFGCGMMAGMLAWHLQATLAGAPGAAAQDDPEAAAHLGAIQGPLAGARLTAMQLAALRDATGGDLAREQLDYADGLLDAFRCTFDAGMAAVDAAWASHEVLDTDPIAFARGERPITRIAARTRTIRRGQRGARLAEAQLQTA